MPDPTPQQLIADPRFHSLPVGDRISALAGIDPDFARLNPADRVRAISQLVPEQQNLSSMSPQDIASQALQASGVTGTQRIAPSAPRVDMQEQSPTSVGAYGNAVADNVNHAASFYGAAGKDAANVLTDPRTYAGGPVSGGIDALTNIPQTVRDIQNFSKTGASPQQASAFDRIAAAANVNQAGIKDASQRQDYAAIGGHSVVPIATALVMGKALDQASPAASELIPSKARAGENFAAVKATAGDMPIDVNLAGTTALRIDQLSKAGGSMPKVVRDFIKRTTDPAQGPMTYAEARDFYSNATRLSADEFNRLTPVMRQQVGEFTRDLGKSIGQSASDAGVGPQYQSAMKEYASASRVGKRVDAAKGVAIDALKKAIPVAAAAYTGKKIWEGTQ